MPLTKLEETYQKFQLALTSLKDAQKLDTFSAVIETFANLLDEDEFQQADYPESLQETLAQQYQEIDLWALKPQQRRLLLQMIILKTYQTEKIQANHQMTPDTIGLLVGYLVEKMTANKSKLKLCDLAIGTGNLLATVVQGLLQANKDLQLSGIDNDDTQLTLASLAFELLQQPINLLHQDALAPLVLDLQDVIIGDLPVGYYPLDQRSQGYMLHFEEGHAYTHYLMIEQTLRYLQPAGLGILLVPSDLFMQKAGTKVLECIKASGYFQAFLNLPANLFNANQSQKSILVIQKHGSTAKQAKQVLLGDFPDLKDQLATNEFLTTIEEWIKQEF